MTENVDTYVLPTESVSFLAEVLPASDPLRITWEVLTDEEREGYLSAALRSIENLTFIGRKTQQYQPLKFPRMKHGNGCMIGYGRVAQLSAAFGGYSDGYTTPNEVKRAQVYWAAVIAKDELYLKRRNTEACLALGLIHSNALPQPEVPKKVYELLHNWVTNWRRV